MDLFVEKTEVWEAVLAELKNRLNKNIFDTWFMPVKFEGIDESNCVIKLSVGDITRDWIVGNYLAVLREAITRAGFAEYEIEWVDNSSANKIETFPEDSDVDFFFEIQQPAPTPLAEIHKERAGRIIQPDNVPIENSLNQKYTFDKFVVGSSNQFAHAASMGAAETPGTTYNPLFIYGGVGLGKTHLMHAIGHSIKERNKHVRVSYITSEKFMNELINAIRYDKTQNFREKYRSIDVLLMDDIQFLAGKERTQEEFFHTFNTLYNDQKQIVMTSDCPPREIPTLEERLHSRFQWGLIADIEPPDLETKVAILKRKADLDGIDLPDEIAIYIANKVRSNVRELEGSLVRLVAISSLRGIPISKMLAQDAMKNIIDSERPEGLTMERIGRTVASHYKLTIDELKSKNNSRSISTPRQVAMYLCKRLTKNSYPEIGKEFGGKHHTTVMHSYDKIDRLTKEDRNFHNTISELIDMLCG